MGEDVVGLVLATGEAGLLPEGRELLKKLPAGSQVQHILPGQRVIQERVIDVGEEPGTTDEKGRGAVWERSGGRERERERERQLTSCRGQHWYKLHGDTSMQREESGLCVICLSLVGIITRLALINVRVKVCVALTSRRRPGRSSLPLKPELSSCREEERERERERGGSKCSQRNQ